MSGYTDQILREAARPTGAGVLVSARRHAAASNPTCGDEVELDVDDDGARVIDVAHRTRGCAFTRASASLLARTVLGISLAEARELSVALRRDLPSSGEVPVQIAMLAAVRVYPARVRCALLPWIALDRALARA